MKLRSFWTIKTVSRREVLQAFGGLWVIVAGGGYTRRAARWYLRRAAIAPRRLGFKPQAGAA